ncbi:6-phosphofructokinase, partial [Anaerosalibacter bizertensis]|nr:6-phosphofructokinase [Anaerosalibacter bizertensis]
MKTIGVLTSGGDSPGMNAAIRAVVRTSIYNNVRIMGIKQGYNGLINGNIEEMNLSSVADIIHRGGTILRTARCDEFTTEKGLQKALNVIRIFNIDGII